MNSKPVLMALVMSSVVLAGCTGDDADVDSLELGLGGISGLLVDDTFRPIHLTDDPNGEFEASGSILVAPLGDLIQTSVNGEFTLEGLVPGTYTLQVQADGYEAASVQVEVQANELTEVTIEARRIVNEGGQVITQEYAIFIDCWYIWPAWRHTEVNCFTDLSGDSKRGGMRADYSHIDNVSYMVAEFLLNDERNYDTDIGYGEGEVIDEVWARGEIRGGDYSRLVLSTSDEARAAWEAANEAAAEPGATEDPHALYDGPYDGFLNNTVEWIAIVWPLGDPTPVELPVGNSWVGFGVSTKAQVVTTLFIGEPDLPDGQTVDDYCAICA